MSAQVDVLSQTGEKMGAIELPDALFAAKVSEFALYRAVVAYQANQRQGNASTKTRSEVNRTSKKHHRQKGTGMARRGSLRSPLVRGGGVAFGPKPHSYRLKMPRTLKRLAFYSALSLKARDQQVRVIDDFDLPAPSTRVFAKAIQMLGLKDQKVVFVTPSSSVVLVKSCRNIPGVQIRPVGTLCTWDIASADVVLFTRQALQTLIQAGAGSIQPEGSGGENR